MMMVLLLGLSIPLRHRHHLPHHRHRLGLLTLPMTWTIC